MAYKALWDVTQQFNNKNGSILTGGKIYIYYEGRTAQADTFKDEAGTVLNTNPVLLDNNGRANVFVNPIYKYTIVVTNFYGVELFSQDITIHDAISTAEDVVIVGTDGSVLIDTTQLPNGVQYDLTVNKNIMATKSSVDDVIDDLGGLTNIVNTHTTDISNINTTLGNKKDKQSIYTASGGPTKTITRVDQDSNGELNITYQDIDLPPSVPNILITSDNESIEISESTDAITNTKTIDLQINGINEYGQFSASNVVVGANLSKVKGTLELDNGNIKLKKGSSYHFTLRGEYIAVRSNTIDVIDFIEHSSGNVIKVDVDNTVDGIQNFELSYDVYNLTQDINYSVSFNNLPGIISELMLYVHNIGVISSGSGSGTTYTNGDGIDITNDEITVNAGNGLGFNAEGQLEVKGGTGLDIDNDGKIISVGGGTTYTNGDGIDITNDVISVKVGSGLDIDNDGKIINVGAVGGGSIINHNPVASDTLVVDNNEYINVSGLDVSGVLTVKAMNTTVTTDEPIRQCGGTLLFNTTPSNINFIDSNDVALPKVVFPTTFSGDKYQFTIVNGIVACQEIE